VDSTYLTGKRVFIFGDATHAIAAARIASEELGFEVVGLGTYSREQAREVRAAAEGVRPRGADHRRLPRGRGAVAELAPELVLGTQMERHIAKRAGHPLRGDLGAGACAGLPGALLPRRWASRAPTSSSTPGCTR
jgi:light-independent protochlorophyllide reductase subunit B